MMKYISWETFSENVLLNGHYLCELVKFLSELWTIFENLLKLWMLVMKRAEFIHVMQLAGKNVCAIFLEMKNTFQLTRE